MKYDYPILEVVWEDSHGLHGWSTEYASGDAPIKSVGYALEDDERGITLVESIAMKDEIPDHEFKHWGCSNFIPRSAVRSLKVLSQPPDSGAQVVQN